MKAKNIIFMVLVVFTYVATSILNEVSFGATFREGVFEVNLPSSFSRVSKSKLDELRRAMIEGVMELAEASKLVDPRDISEKGISFFSVFQNQNGKLLLVFMGMPSPVVMDRDEMYRTNSERTKWGIDSGRLRKTSKGVSKLSIDGAACLLQDIEIQGGERVQTYLFFLPEAPKGTFQFAIICDDNASCDANVQDIEAIIKSLKVFRQSVTSTERTPLVTPISPRSQTTKTDDQVYTEFEGACRVAEQHKGFLLDPKSKKPLPIYITTPEPPPKKERHGSISGRVSTGMTRAQVRHAVGWPDGYYLQISAGADPNNLQDDLLQEVWQYGDEDDMLWFDRRKDRLDRVETKKK